jgi:hypothetical protein
MKYILTFKLAITSCIVLFSTALTAIEIKKQSDFQQVVHHEINVEIFPETSEFKTAVLMANQTITYFNNASVDLDTIWFHIWPNAYKNNQTAYAKQQANSGKKQFLLSKHKGFCEVSNVKINNKDAILHQSHTEIAFLALTSPLKTGDSLVIRMDFKVQMPELFSRLGTKGLFNAATQWYPKPAVYDVNGWNTMPYLEQGEFYSEFGNYKVSITAPANYFIGATGELQNPEKEMEWMKMRTKELSEIKKDELDEYFEDFKQDSVTKTLTFVQHNVHDFAWFASPRQFYYYKTVKLNTGKEVFVELFSESTNNEALNHTAECLIKYSDAVGEYPYNVCKVVIGNLIAGGGMEYPTITVCVNQSKELIIHEVGHNWFYGILASNERRWPWMDESVNSFYENKFASNDDLNLQKLRKVKKYRDVYKYLVKHPDKFMTLDAHRNGVGQPANAHSEAYSSVNYFAVVYQKAARYFDYLESYLGAAVFEKCMKTYFEKWKFKHPLPDDMQAVFNEVSGMDLSWFFQDLLSDKKGLDFQITGSENSQQEFYAVSIRNKTGLMIPVQYAVYVDGKMFESDFLPPFLKDTTIKIEKHEEGEEVMLIIDPFHYLPELNRIDNMLNLERKRVIKPLSITALPVIDHPYSRELGIHPVFIRNLYSGFGLGVMFNNHFYPSKKFEYSLAPIYAFKSGNLNAIGDLRYNFKGVDSVLRKISLGVHYRRFDYLPNQHENVYNKINPYMEFQFYNKGSIPIRVNRKLRVDFNRIVADKSSYEIYNPIIDTTYNFRFSSHNNASLMKVTYFHEDIHATRPLAYTLAVEGGESYDNTNNNKLFAKAEFRFKINLLYNKNKFNKKGNKKFRGEFNTGQFLFNDRQMSGIYLYRGSGNNGVYDYDFSEYHFGRNSMAGTGGLHSKQMITRSGDMRINAPSFAGLGYSSIKTETGLPGFIPFRLYADFSIEHISNPQLFAVGGASIVIQEDVFELYFPLVYSQSFDNYFSFTRQGFFDRFCFKLNLAKFFESQHARNLIKKGF